MTPAFMPIDHLHLYIKAVAAYRLVLRKALKKAQLKYGDEVVLRYFDVSSDRVLVDSLQRKFVDRRRLSQFFKTIDPPNSAAFIAELYEGLRASEDISKFADCLRQMGHTALANDILFFLEHRISAIRKELEVELGRLRQRKKIETPAAAFAYSHG